MDRKMITGLLGIYTAPLNFLLKNLPIRKQKALKSELLKHLRTEEEYEMLSFFPKSPENLHVKGVDTNFGDVAIIIQGPIVRKDDFTVHTVKMYKQYYNHVKIIVSTWKDTEKDLVEKIESLGAVVLLNAYPPFAGYGNINYQLASSSAGAEKARELGVKYVLKTRTDQRFYNPCALSYLIGMYRENRIVLLGGIANSLYTRCFYISDFMAFGLTEEIQLLYSCDYCTEEWKETLDSNKKSAKFKKYAALVEEAEGDCRKQIPSEYGDAHIRYGCAEIFLAYNYFCQKTDPDKYATVQEAYDDFLKKYAIVIDADSLGFYWLKYDHQVFRQNWFERLGKLDTGKWLSVCENK